MKNILIIDELYATPSVQVTFDKDDDLKISGGGLEGFYVLDQMHFHWGGSEHKFGTIRYTNKFNKQ